MSFLDAIQAVIDDENQLFAASPRRERGKLLADMVLVHDGEIIVSETVDLSSSTVREAWAAKISGVSGVDAGSITSALLQIVPRAFGEVQKVGTHQSVSDGLVNMVKDRTGGESPTCKLYRDAELNTYVHVQVGTHWETYPTKSLHFRSWLMQEGKNALGTYPKGRAVDEAIEMIEAMARFEGEMTQVHVRIAHHGDAIYLDLGDAEGHVVEITPEGWHVVMEAPAKFRRTRGMLPLPVPVEGGSILELKKFLNVPQDDDTMFILMVSCLIGAFRPKGPYPVLVIQGAKGTAKSSMMRIMRSILDPNMAPIRSLPRDERDLMISATNSWYPCFDNLSYISASQSDALCRLSTGGGWATRKLFADTDETILDAQRPVILTGIGDMVTKSDLLDRSVLVVAPTIPPEQRRPEEEVWAEFMASLPSLLGAVLTAVSVALRNEQSVSLSTLPRLADFAKWVVAAETALPWEAGRFMLAYDSSRREAHLMALEASAVAQALQVLGRLSKPEWIGTPTELLEALNSFFGIYVRQPKGWPTTPTVLTGKLKEVLPDLNAIGIFIDWSRSGPSRRVTVNFAEWQATQPQVTAQSALTTESAEEVRTTFKSTLGQY